jgi:hypothetical protein
LLLLAGVAFSSHLSAATGTHARADDAGPVHCVNPQRENHQAINLKME